MNTRGTVMPERESYYFGVKVCGICLDAINPKNLRRRVFKKPIRHKEEILLPAGAHMVCENCRKNEGEIK